MARKSKGGQRFSVGGGEFVMDKKGIVCSAVRADSWEGALEQALEIAHQAERRLAAAKIKISSVKR